MVAMRAALRGERASICTLRVVHMMLERKRPMYILTSIDAKTTIVLNKGASSIAHVPRQGMAGRCERADFLANA